MLRGKFLVVGLVVSLIIAAAQATDVFGPVYGNWTIQGSPYYAVDSIYVPTDCTLVIDAGVQVIFWGHFKFGVHPNATLKAHGVEGDSILFTTPWEENGWWGIRFNGSSPACSLAYCVFEYGRASGSYTEDQRGGAIYATHASPAITHSRFSFCRAYNIGGAIWARDESNMHLTDCTFSADTANYGGGIYAYYAAPIIENCTFTGNVSFNYGGAIECEYAAAHISGSTFTGNLADYGGAIYLYNSAAVVTSCILNANLASVSDAAGGAIYCSGSNAEISQNVITGNAAVGGTSTKGGGIYVYSAAPQVHANLIEGNTAYYGGGIYCYSTTAQLVGNTISSNYAFYNGGGICTGSSAHPDINFNEIRENYTQAATGRGGGIYFESYSDPDPLNKNTFYGNSAQLQGGAMYLTNSTLWPKNSIFWGNSAPAGAQIYLANNSAAIVTFSDVQGGWPGSGNLNVWPMFADTSQNDLHLTAGSPCVDHGDQHPEYNDPDFTPADMGCYYFPQQNQNPLSMEITPQNPPIQIPFYGGTFDYRLSASNSGIYAQMMQVWCSVTLPWGAEFGPVLGPYFVPISAGSTLSTMRTQAVPINAPGGEYVYSAYVVVEQDTLTDSFTFEKLMPAGGAGVSHQVVNEWENWGSEFGVEKSASLTPPAEFRLLGVYPNPFNPAAAISYQLTALSHVSLKVYDTAGRLVATLVDGWREAGSHEVTFDGAGLPSGIYIYRLTAGDYNAFGKMVLMK